MRVTKKVIELCLERLPMAKLESIEKIIRQRQGKGTGGKSSHAAEVRSVLPLLPEQHVVLLDVGASTGSWTEELLRRKGPQAFKKIFLIEPSLKSNMIALDKFANLPVIELSDVVLSDTTGEQTIYFPEEGSTLTSIYSRQVFHTGACIEQSRKVKSITLDSFLTERGVEVVDFMKLDVEGHEFCVLKGARESLHAGRIRALSFEVGGCNIDSRTFFRDFWNELTPFGYKIYRIGGTGERYEIDRYSEKEEIFVTTNYLAVLTDNYM